MNFDIYITYITEVFRNMKAQRLRTLITLVIIAIGILALVGTLTVVDALNNTFTGNLKTIGANSFTIRRYQNSLLEGRQRRGHFWRKKNNPPITEFEAQTFKKRYNFEGALVSLSFLVTSQAELVRGQKKTSGSVEIFGVDENYARVYHFQIDKGRNFTANEINSGIRYAVIGPQVAKSLFEKENPLGQALTYKGRKWTVIGVTKEKGTAFGRSEDNFVWVPLQVGKSILPPRRPLRFDIRVSVEKPEKYEEAEDKAIALMRAIRRLRPDQPNNFGIVGSKEALQEIKQIDSVLRTAAFIIGLITILASSIALMNIMLVTVAEKLREIGIRKAVGASNREILKQFLTETLIIAFSGSIFGIIGGILLGWGIALLMKIDFVMPWTAVFWAVLITFITALISGLYPAIKASRANPIEVLHYE